MDKDWKVCPDDLNIESRVAGISGFMRLKNEETYLDAAIASHIDYVDELILVYNNCTDSTPEICQDWAQRCPDKVKVYEYGPYVYPLGTTESRTFSADNEQTLANFYNYSLTKTTRTIAIKIDGDHIAVPDVFKQAAGEARGLESHQWLSLRGANLYECNQGLYVSNGYHRALNPGEGRKGGTPPLTGGDHAFFMVQPDTWHEMDPQEGYEVLKLHKIKSEVISYQPLAFLHLKGVKSDRGMDNWELDRYKDSSRHRWSKAVSNTQSSSLLTLEECAILYGSYYSNYPDELLRDYGITYDYAKSSIFRNTKARLHRLLHNEEVKLTH